MKGFKFAVPGLVIALLMAISAAAQQSPQATGQDLLEPPLPLESGQGVYITTNGCGVIYELPDAARADLVAYWNTPGKQWSGPCRNGLAHGVGVFGTEQEVADAVRYGVSGQLQYGQSMEQFIQTFADGSVMYRSRGDYISLDKIGADFGFQWPSSDDLFQQGITYWKGASDQVHRFRPSHRKCEYLDRNEMSAEDKRANARCSERNRFTVFAIETSSLAYRRNASGNLADYDEIASAKTYCPDPKRSEGCDALWLAALEPHLPAMQAIITDARIRDAALRNDMPARFARWEQELTALRETRRLADIAVAEQAQAEKEAAAAVAAADFRASLADLNAGQLFALADELTQEERADDARTALRELLSRYPDHPLAALAAQQLVAPPAAQSTPSQTQSGAASPVPAVAPARPNDGLIDVRLADRWTSAYEDTVIARLSPAKYDEIAAKARTCEANNYQIAGCDPPTFIDYPVSIVNPFQLSTDTSGRTSPTCKYSPGTFYLPDISRRPAEQTCAVLLQQALHEFMTNAVTALRAGQGLLNAANVTPIPGTTSGNCEADLRALSDGGAAISARQPPATSMGSLVQSAQLALYLTVNRYRVFTTSCKGTPYEEGAAELVQLAGEEKNRCEQFATNKADCVPKIPF